MKLERHSGNPILTPASGQAWESAGISNPGAWFDGETYHLLYTGYSLADTLPPSFGLATSRDGITFERAAAEPVFGPSNDGFDGGCVENARLVRYGDIYYVTYATRMFRPLPPGSNLIPLHAPGSTQVHPVADAVRHNLTRGALAATRDFRAWFRMGAITQAAVDDEHVVLFPEELLDRCALLHRPNAWVGPQYGCDKPSIWISFGPDLMSWKNDHLLAQPEQDWESKEIAASAPPVRTKKGWLLLYHAVDDNDVCRTGALLLDLTDPTRVRGRTREPLLEPEMDYERDGPSSGSIVCSGAVVAGDTLNMYYGANAGCIGLARAPVEDLAEFVLAQSPTQ